MSDSDSGVLGIIGLLIIAGSFAYAGYDLGVLLPARIEKVNLQFETDGFSVQEVTINSPNVYFEIDDYEEFKEILREQGSSKVYRYSRYYYIFNDDYTLAWRIYGPDIYEEIK